MSQSVNTEKVLIFDFGSQFAQLIARRVREQNVYCEIVRHDLSAARVKELAPAAVLSSAVVRRASTKRALKNGQRDFRSWNSSARHLLRHASHRSGTWRQS